MCNTHGSWPLDLLAMARLRKSALLKGKMLLLLLTSINAAEGQTYELQPSGKIDNETYLLAHLPSHLPPLIEPPGDPSAMPLLGDPQYPDTLEEFSLCIAFSIFSRLPMASIFSYFERDDDALHLGFEDMSFRFCYLRDCQWIGLEVYPDIWHQLCIIATHNTFFIYHHGTLLESMKRMEKKLPLGGIAVLGQEQDLPGAGFSSGQAFSGHVTQLGIWARLLTPQELNDIAQCNLNILSGNLLPWGTSIWQQHGRVTLVNISYCHKLVEHIFPFWELVPFNAAIRKLKSLQMELGVPRSTLEEDQVKQLLEIAPIQCSNPYSNNKFVIVNAFFNESTKILFEFNSNTTLNHTVMGSLSTGLLDSGMVVIGNNGEWRRPFSNEHCYLGEYLIKRPTIFLRGLCEISTNSISYSDFVMSTNKRYPLYFAGLTGTAIIQEGTMWYLIHRSMERPMASIQSMSLPLGRREWNVTGQDRQCTQTQGLKTLTLSPCNQEQFTCNDGTCIPLMHRCNLVPDCEDWSDEHYCKMVSLPEGYLPHLPPPPPINFNLKVFFKKVELDIKTMTFTTKIKIILEWNDRRVNFLNLRDGPAVNFVANENGDGSGVVWKPRLEWSDIVDHGPFENPVVYVKKQTNGSFQRDDMMYHGANNSLILTDIVMPRFECPLDLEMYPWDSQTCNITISVTNIMTGSNLFSQHKVQYIGKQELQEYLLSDWTLNPFSNTAQLSFRLTRRYDKHVWMTFVPTSLLLGISYGTLFLPTESFPERGTMSLTTLLVLVSLYTEALSSLPVTSYNKQIEKWYLCLIIYVSLVIAVHLVTSNLEAHFSRTNVNPTNGQLQGNINIKKRNGNYNTKLSWPWQRQIYCRPRNQKMLSFARLVFGIALLLILAFFSFSLI